MITIWPFNYRKKRLLEKSKALEAQIEQNRDLSRRIITLTGKLLASIDEGRENSWFLQQHARATNDQLSPPNPLPNTAPADSCL